MNIFCIWGISVLLALLTSDKDSKQHKEGKQ